MLMYHMVSPHRKKARFNKLRVLPERFEEQLAWLQENGFQFVFASQLCDGTKLPGKTVCLTFDDGYADNLLIADPIMEKYGAVGTLYLVEDRSGGWSSKKKSHHEDDELASEPKLTDLQVEQMLQSGRWELGGHTVTHANLPNLDGDEAAREITDSRNRLTEQFGQELKTFAYPFGLLGDREVRLAREAGYSAAVTTEPRIYDAAHDDLMMIPRIKVSGTEGMAAFAIRIRTGQRGLLK